VRAKREARSSTRSGRPLPPLLLQQLPPLGRLLGQLGSQVLFTATTLYERGHLYPRMNLRGRKTSCGFCQPRNVLVDLCGGQQAFMCRAAGEPRLWCS
jgi:hypothetical protein